MFAGGGCEQRRASNVFVFLSIVGCCEFVISLILSGIDKNLLNLFNVLANYQHLY